MTPSFVTVCSVAPRTHGVIMDAPDIKVTGRAGREREKKSLNSIHTETRRQLRVYIGSVFITLMYCRLKNNYFLNDALYECIPPSGINQRARTHIAVYVITHIIPVSCRLQLIIIYGNKVPRNTSHIVSEVGRDKKKKERFRQLFFYNDTKSKLNSNRIVYSSFDLVFSFWSNIIQLSFKLIIIPDVTVT